MTYLWNINASVLQTLLSSALEEAKQNPNARANASIHLARFQLYVSVDSGGGVLLTFRRPKGKVSLREVDTLIELMDLELHSLVKMPAKKSNEPWWVATAEPVLSTK